MPSQGPAQMKPPPGHFYLAGRLFPRKKWWRDKNMRTLYFFIAVLIFTNTANGFDNSMMNGLQAISYWQDYFNHPSGPTLGLFNCVMSAGALSGLVPMPFIMDRLGRKPCLIIGAFFMILGIALQASAINFAMFIAARWILGFGDILVICTAPLLIAEIAPVQDRAILVTIAGANYQSGAFIAAWTTYGTLQIQSDWAWRAPSLIQGIFTILMIAVVPWIPESPRFYIAKDQPEKALKILAQYHANGDEQEEVVQLEFTEITTALAMEKNAQKSFSFLDFLRTPGNRKRLIMILSIGLFSQWSGNGLVSYYLTTIMNNIGIKSPQTQLGINGGLTTFSLILNIIFSFFVDKWGRRPINLISTIGMLLTFVIWTILSAIDAKQDNANPAYGKSIVFMIFFYNLWYNLKSGLIASYTTEILPYHMRAKGYTVMEYALYGALFFNQFVNATALNNIHWKYYIFYCCFLGFELVIVYFFYVETRYVPLEEIVKYFDGDDVAAVTNEEFEHGGKNAVIHVEESKAA
ncbi:hexose transporter, putative [Talaromyces stipitatus ATCC 10500]|uniref:Hexose transporter, putative n=1 Tax=Talaromyces stipitatus (strain ATCC 10500 / CBS 375.48 / QM 6759 / NRRL 1006) TaxID=441959 RepID=B8MQP5_TALSN|nr:hexose transporter, putative [Talaromyces stipitatus ATCC 10500]EED13468.1 hexose transporter, putative [Talaromyces stipitatus ATCC 10500]